MLQTVKMDAALLTLVVSALTVLCGATPEFPGLNNLRSTVSASDQAQAVTDLINRKVPQHSHLFSVTVQPQAISTHDTFKLSTTNGHVNIVGSSGVAASMGFYYYIKQYCGCHVSWAGDQLALPDVLPNITQPLTVTTSDTLRYYQNVCTSSYSFVWWQWERWEQEIDWMALQGINLPLAFTAQEAIWQRVLVKFGFNQAEIDAFLSGPAFLAWQRMGNLRGWGGPLPQSWNAQQLALQHRILDRMRSLGMLPVLPGFAGHVPQAIKRLYPAVSVTTSTWGNLPANFTHVYLLNVTDPLFVHIGTLFLQEYIHEFGTNHVYNADTFNEMAPSSGDPEFVRAAGKAVYSAMTGADPDAIWLMQGWLFLEGYWTWPRAEALLTSVPIGKMIVLDLASDTTPQFQRLKSYAGQPWIWCMLHNYGATLPMYGKIDTINSGPAAGRSIANSTMIGVGISPEGINQNNVIYEFMLENVWRTESRDLSVWFTDYATQRYGQYNQHADKAWQKLKTTVYNCTDNNRQHGHGKVVLALRPTMRKRKPDIWYDIDTFMQGWDEFVLAADAFSLKPNPLYQYDLVDVTRQALQITAAAMYEVMLGAYSKHNTAMFSTESSALLELLTDLDEVLGTDGHFLLGAWIKAARDLGTTDQERKLYEYNARNQITLWGPTGNILDYATKQWSGLMSDYYRARWQLFTDTVIADMKAGRPFAEADFRNKVLTQVEQPFTFAAKSYPDTPSGDAISVVKKIHAKYRPQIRNYRTIFDQITLENTVLYKKDDTNQALEEMAYSYMIGGVDE